MIGPQTPTPKKVVMMLMVKWLCLMWKLLILLGMIHHKSLCTIVTRKTLQPNYFIFRNFQKVQVYIIFLLNKPSCFILRRAKMWLMQSRTKQFFYFVLANIIVPIEDILDMNNVGDMLTQAARYNARIWFHYIAWDFKIRLSDLNEVKTVLLRWKFSLRYSKKWPKLVF